MHIEIVAVFSPLLGALIAGSFGKQLGAKGANLVTCALMLRLLSPVPVLFQAALAAGIYPPLAVLLTRAHQALAEHVDD